MNIIQNLTNDLLMDQQLLAPIVLSDSALSAIDTLNAMLESISNGSHAKPIFLDFLNDNIKYSVDVLALNVDGQLVPNTLSSIVTTSTHDISSNAGCYLLQNSNVSSMYIGSAVDFVPRMSFHFNALNSGIHINRYHSQLLESEGVNGVYWGYVYSTVNYFALAKDTLVGYKLSLGETDFLKALTEFVPHVLEQSLLTEFSPNLNKSLNIPFTHTSWDYTRLTSYFTPIDDPSQVVEISIEKSDGSKGSLIQSCDSFKHACQVLDCNITKVRRYLNSQTGFMCLALGCRVTLSLVGFDLLKLLRLQGGPLTELSPFVVWAFYPNKTSFLGPFISVQAAYQYLNPVQHFHNTKEANFQCVNEYFKYRNSETLISTEKGDFFIAYNPIKQPSIKKVIKAMPKSPFTS